MIHVSSYAICGGGVITTARSTTLTAQRLARAAGEGTAGTALNAVGIPYTPGAGGAALYNSKPGGKLPNIGGSGVRGSGGFGGVGVSDNSPIGAYRGSQTFRGLAPRIAADLQKDFGLSKEDTSAILGNLGHESVGFTAFQERKPRGGGRGGWGWGWAQWTGSRRRQFEAWAAAHKLDPKSYEANYGFLRHELQTTYKGSITALKRAYGLEGKTIAFEKSFEGAAADAKGYGSRLKYARQALSLPDSVAGVTGPNVAAKASETLGGKPGTYQDLGDGIRGKPFQRASDLAKESPAERLARTAPVQSQGGAGAGRSGASIAPVFNIHQAGNAEHTANEVQRRLAETTNYLPQDLPAYV